MPLVPSPLKLAVIGLGVMGARHARCVAAHAGAQLTAVVDIDAALRGGLSKELGCAAYKTADELVDKIDAAIVAVPTALHADVAVTLLAAGIGCLVEKPFVSNRDEGARVVATAKARNAALQVGHIERFNPAVSALLAHVGDAAVKALTVRRMNAGSARVKDVDVVMDLMVHDIDVVLALKRQPVVNVSATGNGDHARALLAFRDGTVADITASRTYDGRLRDLHAVLENSALEMDYVARTLTEKTGANTIALPVEADDALTMQLDSFLRAIKGASPVVSAADGLKVMDVAWRVQAALGLAS